MIVGVCSDRDGRTWICPGAVLPDPDIGQKDPEEIYILALHSTEKLPCILGRSQIQFGQGEVERKRTRLSDGLGKSRFTIT